MLKFLFRRNNKNKKKTLVANEDNSNNKVAAAAATNTALKQQNQQQQREKRAEQVHIIMSNIATSLEQLNSTALKMTDDPATQLRFKTNSFSMKCMHGKK